VVVGCFVEKEELAFYIFLSRSVQFIFPRLSDWQVVGSVPILDRGNVG
jgi:hypothetical protein